MSNIGNPVREWQIEESPFPHYQPEKKPDVEEIEKKEIQRELERELEKVGV